MSIKKKNTKKVGFTIKANPSSVIWESEKTTCKEAVLDALENDVILRGSDLSGCDLSGCDFRGCDLSGCDLRGCDLSGCDLRGCDLRDCDLRDCDLSYAILRACDLRDVDLRGCDLNYTEMGDTKFGGRGTQTKLNKDQVEDLHKALGIVVK